VPLAIAAMLFRPCSTTTAAPIAESTMPPLMPCPALPPPPTSVTIRALLRRKSALPLPHCSLGCRHA
jgi:hypothetical protein